MKMLTMSLVTLKRTGPHSGVHAIVVSPASSHRTPSRLVIIEKLIERKTVPPSTRHSWVVPEHGPRLSGSETIALPQGIHWDVESTTKVEKAVIGG